MNFNLDILDNNYVAVLIALFLGLYGYTLSRVEIPDYIRNLFSNNIFRIVWLSMLLIFNFNKSPHASILISMVFVLTLHYLNEREIKENFVYLEIFKQQLNKNRLE